MLRDEFPKLKHWSSDFKDKYKTTFVTNATSKDIKDNYIVTKTMVSGMGLSWGSQYVKIKNRFGCFVKEIPIGKGLTSGVCLLNERLLEDYLETIETNRVSGQAKDRVKEYKESFLDFVNRETANDDLTIFDSYIDNGFEGMQKLIRDVSNMNYISGYDRIARILHELMESPNLNIDELILSNEIHEIADYLSKNQFKLRN